MSNEKLVKTMTVPVRPGSTSERLVRDVRRMEAKHKQQVPGAMRDWLFSGFELAQLEHGIMESWLAMANGGQLRHMSHREKATVLKNIIDRTIWIDEPVSHDPKQPELPTLSRTTDSSDPSPEKDTHGIPGDFDLAEEF